MLCCGIAANAQMQPFDSGMGKRVVAIADTGVRVVVGLPDSVVRLSQDRIKDALKGITKEGLKAILPISPVKTKGAGPLLQFNGGYAAYNMQYRGLLDTPFVEQSVYQHNLTGRMGVSVSNLPLQVSYLVRHSNSIFYKDIIDVQVNFDVNQYRNNLMLSAKQRLLEKGAGLKDPLLEMNFNIKQQLVDSLGGWLRNPLNRQRLIESHEIVELPPLPDIDSATRVAMDSAKQTAKAFIAMYEIKSKQYEQYRTIADSVSKQYHQMMARVQAYKELVQKGFDGKMDAAGLEKELQSFGISEKLMPARFRWLLGIKRMAVGRSIVNQSPLTAQNLGISGINMAYQHKNWYVAVTAGTVNQRFRDFVASRVPRRPQYIYLLKLGVGREEGSHVFVTVLRGQKQLYTVTNSVSSPMAIDITGVSLELKYQLNRYHCLVAEVAESVSPDFRRNPVVPWKFSLSDQTNKAFALQYSGFIPQTNSRIEAAYRYTGANYQSFNSFQTNAAVRNWRVKWEQYVFGRHLKITAGARSNAFDNPFLIQTYRSDVVFKSLQASFKKRHWPTITAGYMPSVQLTRLGNTVVENQFNSFTASLLHTYKWYGREVVTTALFSQFYNTAADSGFAYFNASNLFVKQSLGFARYTMYVAVSQSKSTAFELNVLDGGFLLRPGRLGSCGFGMKVSNFNKVETVGTFYAQVQLNLKKWGSVQLAYDNGYLPGADNQFVKNTFFNVGYSRIW